MLLIYIHLSHLYSDDAKGQRSEFAETEYAGNHFHKCLCKLLKNFQRTAILTVQEKYAL